jgi:cytidylate kinase
MSRQVGSGADQVANQLCSDLGLMAFDKRLMVRVAGEIGVSEEEIVDYSEDQYKLRTFFEALFRRTRPVAEVSSWAGGRASGYEREVRVLDEDRAIDLVRATVLAAHERGNVLIMGRGSQAILEDKPDVLHVRVVAPFEDRVERIQSRESLSAAQARRLITENDRATQEYLRTFHQVDVDDPSLYHMVLNTGKLGIERTVEMIKQGLEEKALAA